MHRLAALLHPEILGGGTLVAVSDSSGGVHNARGLDPKAIVEHIDRALDLKYADRAHQLRLAAGKDTGVVHFDDGHVRITADLPKKVDWDQKRLAEITQRIAANGDDPSEYVEISYRISETKFNAWPESLKSAFAPARTLKTGKQGFRLALLQE